MRCNGDTGDEDLNDDEFEGYSLKKELERIKFQLVQIIGHMHRKEYEFAAYHLGHAQSELDYITRLMQTTEDEPYG